MGAIAAEPIPFVDEFVLSGPVTLAPGLSASGGRLPLPATLADLFGEPRPKDPEWVARLDANLSRLKALCDSLPNPEFPWEPGDLGRLIWDSEERRPRTWLCDPASGELLTDEQGAPVPGHPLVHDHSEIRDAPVAGASIAIECAPASPDGAMSWLATGSR